MIIVIVGASGSGKSAISKELVNHFGMKEIISYTTREKRPGEVDGIDYNFISSGEFFVMRLNNKFVECEEYSGNRWYGTSLDDINLAANSENYYVAVVTPNGLRNIEKAVGKDKLYSVYVEADLGTRVKRYIDRCGEHNFDFNDMNEINARVNRDFGMFLNMENQVDFVIQNNDEIVNGKSGLAEVATKIYEQVQKNRNRYNDYIER